MLKNLKKCLDTYETVCNKLEEEYVWDTDLLTSEEKDILDYFDMYLAKAIMSDLTSDDSEAVAKIILAMKGAR